MKRQVEGDINKQHADYQSRDNKSFRNFYHTSAKVLTLSFNYRGKMQETKALVTHASGLKLYKVVLYSRWNEYSTVCWLQKNVDKWEIVIGDIEPDLKKALIAAIDMHEYQPPIRSIKERWQSLH